MSGILQKLTKSKTLKVFLVAIVLVFSFQVNKPKAFVPLAWAGAVLTGLAAETLVTMGVKAYSKAQLKKKASEYSAKALKEGKFDFMGTNPYRNKDGSITLSPSANDRAKMAGLIAGGLTGAMVGDGMTDGESCLPDFQGGMTYDPASSDALLRQLMSQVEIRDVNSSIAVLHWFNQSKPFTGVYYDAKYLDQPKWVTAALEYDNAGVLHLYVKVISQYEAVERIIGSAYVEVPGYMTDSMNVASSVGEEIIYCDGIYMPSTMPNVYEPPMDMTPEYIMPNDDLLKDRPLIIYDVFAPSETEKEITWEDVENQYNGDVTAFESVIDGNVDNYLEKGVIVNNTYTIGEINNIYTDIGQEQSKEEFEQDVNELPLVPPEEEVPGEIVPVSPVDRSMLQVMRESYQFLTDGIDSSIQSMKTVTDGATGLINYLDNAFRWLPAEWRAMFGAAFVLGVFAHFFRR